MQFIGAKGITLFVAIILIACGTGFGSGLLVGRQFPAHHFERFGNTSYLLDSATGRVCGLYSFDSSKNTPDLSKHPTLEELLNSDNPGYPPPCEK